MAQKLLEVNPRISTCLYDDGFNMPLAGVQLALGLVGRVSIELANGVKGRYHWDLRCW
jgi:hypothetical protein